MKTLIVDMDDISLDNPDANGLNYAFYLKGKFPKFALTLFTIPGRSTKPWLEELMRIPWIKIAMHGYNHDEEEEITDEMLQDMGGFSKVYKGPNWKVTPAEIEVLKRNYWGLAVQEKTTDKIPQWPLTDPRSFHGHCWIKSDWEKLEALIEPDTKFKFIEQYV